RSAARRCHRCGAGEEAELTVPLALRQAQRERERNPFVLSLYSGQQDVRNPFVLSLSVAKSRSTFEELFDALRQARSERADLFLKCSPACFGPPREQSRRPPHLGRAGCRLPPSALRRRSWHPRRAAGTRYSRLPCAT